MTPEAAPAQVALRPPEQVMRLARLGSFHASRLSFMRILMRRMKAEGWTFDCPVFAIDDKGVGHAVLTAQTPTRTYALVAFAHDLPADQRSDRVIAEAWDCTYALHDGLPTSADIERLRKNVPFQEAGRVSEKELTLSRTNRSVRMFDHVVDRLAAGQQPDENMILRVGYLMRTTAVYGSGKFGACDYRAICDRPEFAAPFQAEMLTVFLIRDFVRRLAEHLARVRGGEKAVAMSATLARRLGIGNSTGLGMVPYLVNHPALLNNWIAARETALARVRALPGDESSFREFAELVARAQANAAEWHSDHPLQKEKLADLRPDLDALAAHLKASPLTGLTPWDDLYQWGEGQLSCEGQEQLVSLMLEPHGAIVDDLADGMSLRSAAPRIDGAASVAATRRALEQVYGWALKTDWMARDEQARVWYVSAEKLEPRLGERFEEPIADYEQPLAPGRDAAVLYGALADWPDDAPIADLLLARPEHRHMVRRIQIAQTAPYGEIRDNTISATVLPIDMLRCKLSFFGAGHFDPRSDRWVRINMFQNAPYPGELAAEEADDWTYPKP
ncbi:MAG: hypothetical protein GKR99_01695 [Rhodobacteraceae bacterium]|nr:hypothetical protein [Paracoccaceae bacterium]